MKDCEWIAHLLQCGLLRGSFVPARTQRELRDLTRHRTKLVQQHTQTVNRLHAVLPDANIKLSSVATDIMGVSRREMIEALQRGEEDPEQLAELARGRLRAKIPELRVALEGLVRDHHRFLLKLVLDQLDFLTTTIDQLSQRIQEISPQPFQEAVRLLSTADGIQQRTAENVLAETGTDMAQFPSAKHISSWAAVCPGNNESAGKRKSGKTAKGNRWLRGALGEAAWAASHTKDTYLGAQFRRIRARRGTKRAVVAVSHTLLIAIYHMLRTNTAYKDLGSDHFDRLACRNSTASRWCGSRRPQSSIVCALPRVAVNHGGNWKTSRPSLPAARSGSSAPANIWNARERTSSLASLSLGFARSAGVGSSRIATGSRRTSVGCPVSSANALTWKTKPAGVRSAHRREFRSDGRA